MKRTFLFVLLLVILLIMPADRDHQHQCPGCTKEFPEQARLAKHRAKCKLYAQVFTRTQQAVARNCEERQAAAAANTNELEVHTEVDVEVRRMAILF